MTLVTRITEYPNGTKITESFEQESYDLFKLDTPYDQAKDNDVPAEVEPWVIEFIYHGKLRHVSNPAFLAGAWHGRGFGYNTLLGGVEVDSGQYKNFSLSDIQPV